MKKIALLVIILIILTACKKTLYKVELSGRVLDEHTGNPISGIQVAFLGGNVSLSSSGPGYYEKSTVTTGSDGSFLFKFNANDNDAFALIPYFDKNTYLMDIDGNNRPIAIDLKKKFFKEKIHHDIYLKQYSILNIRFKQVSTDTFDIIRFNSLNTKIICNPTSGDQYGIMYPAYMADFTQQFLYYGDVINNFHFGKVTKFAHISIDTSYTLTIPKNSTINYQINY